MIDVTHCVKSKQKQANRQQDITLFLESNNNIESNNVKKFYKKGAHFVEFFYRATILRRRGGLVIALWLGVATPSGIFAGAVVAMLRGSDNFSIPVGGRDAGSL